MRLAVLIIACIYAFTASASSYAVTIRLERTVIVPEGGLRLSDAASVSDASDETASKILDQIIPISTGYCSVIPQRIVRDKVKLIANEPVVISGQRLLAVPASIPQEQRPFYIALLALLDAESEERESRIEVEVDESLLPSYMASPEPPLLKLWTKKTKLGNLSGTSRIEYVLRESGLSGRFDVRVRSFVPVLKALRDIGRDEKVSWENSEPAEAEVAALDSEALEYPGGQSRFNAKSAIRAGSYIYTKSVEQVFDVKARDRVRLVYERGPIRLTMPGLAWESGYLGDFVRVKTAETDKLLSGMITASREVTIHDEAN